MLYYSPPDMNKYMYVVFYNMNCDSLNRIIFNNILKQFPHVCEEEVEVLKYYYLRKMFFHY